MDGRLELVCSEGKSNTRIFCEFVTGPMGYRLCKGGGKNQSIARAVGLKTYPGKLTVLDATAGLGRDGVILASLGCDVHMVERSSIVVALLRDGLKRAAHSEKLSSFIRGIQVTNADAVQILSDLAPEHAPEVVYLDPMFPSEKKSALNKIEMRILREVVGSDLDADRLLSIALLRAKKRVVVKRSRGAPPLLLLERTPSFIVEGKSNRYDVYLRAEQKGFL